MKSAKLKIAAVAMAAISGVCSMQAITASAAVQYTQTAQEVKERQSTMDTYVARWKSGWWNNDYLPNTYWNKTVYSGIIIGGGYNSYVPGSYHQNQALTGGMSLVRSLAQDYFEGTTIFMSFGGGSKEFAPRIGDQICISRNGETRYLFITKTTNGIKAVELVNGQIKYDRSYGVNNGAMTFNGNRWNVNNYLRPIKRGDVNGDSYVYLNAYHNFSGDDAVFQSYLTYGIPGTWSNAIKAALDMNGDGQVTDADHTIWYNNLYWYTTYGTMHGSYGYLKSIN